MAAAGFDDSAAVSLLEDEAVGRRTLRKATWRLIPLLSVCYMVAYMDRANISFAALDMNRDLGFNAGVYGFGAGVFFVSYAMCELPSNMFLLRFGARRWIARIMLTWGVLAAAMMLVRSPASFYGLRFLLGMAEAGFFPGVLYYLSLWFPQAIRARAIGRFYVAFPLSNVVMGLIAGSLLSLNGRLGLRGWQWLFLIEALPAIALSALVWFVLPDGPADAKWMEPEEREWLVGQLRADAAAMELSGGHAAGPGSVVRGAGGHPEGAPGGVDRRVHVSYAGGVLRVFVFGAGDLPGGDGVDEEPGGNAYCRDFSAGGRGDAGGELAF